MPKLPYSFSICTMTMGPPRSIWSGASSWPRRCDPARGRGDEFGIAAAHDHGTILEQPGRKAAELPLGAAVGAGAEIDVEAFLLGLAHELGDVVVAAEVVDAGLGLMHVPEDVGGDGVQAHGFCFAQAVAPVGTRHAGVVHLAGENAEGFAIELEVVADGAKAMPGGGCDLSWAGGGKHEYGEQSDWNECRESHGIGHLNDTG